MESGQIDKAISEYEEALEMAPDAVDARLGLGIALIKRDDFDNALTHLLQAKARDPVRGDIRLHLAMDMTSGGSARPPKNIGKPSG